MVQLAKIIVGFPGIGKSHISSNTTGQYSWLNIVDEAGYVKGKEDELYARILSLCQEPGVLLLPAHPALGAFLVSQNLVFTSVYPKRELKEEYLERYKARGNDAGFVNLLDRSWDIFVDRMHYPEGRCRHIELRAGEFLGDVFLKILTQEDAPRGSLQVKTSPPFKRAQMVAGASNLAPRDKISSPSRDPEPVQDKSRDEAGGMMKKADYVRSFSLITLDWKPGFTTTKAPINSDSKTGVLEWIVWILFWGLLLGFLGLLTYSAWEEREFWLARNEQVRKATIGNSTTLCILTEETHEWFCPLWLKDALPTPLKHFLPCRVKQQISEDLMTLIEKLIAAERKIRR
jgi:TM2 domain-containing membrane protein YozV